MNINALEKCLANPANDCDIDTKCVRTSEFARKNMG